MTPETLADAILQAAGSGLRHYTPHNQTRIVAAAEAQIAALRRETLTQAAMRYPHAIGGRDE